MIELVGFDGDDTLWHSEGYYRAVHDEFERILGGWVDLADARLHERPLATERANLRLFGYGAKGMVLSDEATVVLERASGLPVRLEHRREVALGSAASSNRWTFERVPAR